MSRSPIIVSLGIGGIYPKLLDRLRESCIKFGVKHWLWREYPPGAKSHKLSPYGFKLYVIRQALEKGFETIIWADSAVYIVKDPNPFFQTVRDKDILFFGHGPSLYPWVNDKSLKLFGFEREDTRKHWLVSGALFGFDFSSDKAKKFYEEWVKYEKDGWFCEDNQVRPTKNFTQHRHDEAIVSLMLAKYGIDTLCSSNYFQGDKKSIMFRAGKDI